MPSQPATSAAYLAALPAGQRELADAILQTIRKNADPKFEEGLQYGMPAFYLPHSVYPSGYHCDAKQPLPFASVASRKSGVSIYLFGVYCDPAEQERLQKEWKATGHRLDMGKSCIRVKKLEQVPLDVLGASVRRMKAAKFVKAYEKSVPAAGKQTTTKKAAQKTAKKTAGKAPTKAARKPAKKAAKRATKKTSK